MNRLEAFLSILDHSLNTKKRRHMAGGILLSISVLFGGLAFTVMTVKTDDNENDNIKEMEDFEDLYE